MRVLLSTTSGAGHFRPLLPVARALQRAGHEIACAAPVEAGAMVEREGIRHLPFEGVPADHPGRASVFGRVATMPHADAEHLVGSEVFGRLNTTFALPGARAAVESFRPDLLVHEGGEVAGKLAAEAAGVPTAAVSPTLTIADYLIAMAEGIADLRGSLDLPRDADGALALAEPTLSWFPTTFDLPEAVAYDVRRHRDPDAPQPSPEGDRELVYVTLGSEAADLPFFGPVLRSAVGGALRAGLPVVVSTGKPVPSGLLDGLDGDLQVETWVDQADLLRRARVVVCHAGAGTTLGALAAGVPVVAVPLFADQPHTAARIEATGAGRRVEPGPALEADVEVAVSELAGVLPDGTRRLAAEIAALPPIDDAVPWLESLAG